MKNLLRSVFTMFLILLSCTGSNTGPDRSSGDGTISVTVDLPATIGSSGLEVLIADSVYHLSTGRTEFSFNPGTSLPVLSVVKSGDTPVALSFFCAGNSANSISCPETAVSLIMLKMLLYAASPSLLSGLVEKVRGVDAVGTLGSVIKESFETGGNPLTDPDQSFIDAFSEAQKAVSDMVIALARSEGGN